MIPLLLAIKVSTFVYTLTNKLLDYARINNSLVSIKFARVLISFNKVLVRFILFMEDSK